MLIKRTEFLFATSVYQNKFKKGESSDFYNFRFLGHPNNYGMELATKKDTDSSPGWFHFQLIILGKSFTHTSEKDWKAKG